MKTCVIPLYVPTERHENVVRLSFLKKGDESHYCVINNMSALVNNPI